MVWREGWLGRVKPCLTGFYIKRGGLGLFGFGLGGVSGSGVVMAVFIFGLDFGFWAICITRVRLVVITSQGPFCNFLKF